MGRGHLTILLNTYYQKKKNSKNKNIIPVHKCALADKTLVKEFKIQRFDETEEVQDMYNVLEQAIEYTVEKVGNRRATMRTDDKLSEKTKELLGKRNALNSKA